MDILIKSFNRPYYLDKCIQSILKFVIDSELKILVLDDGTPIEYLNKLQEKYPIISIFKSEFYENKKDLIVAESDDYISKIPINLWVESARNVSDYFLLLEDDFWFTKPINLNNITLDLEQNKIQMLKLCWLGNAKLIPKSITKKINNLNIYKDKLITKNKFLYQLIFHSNNYFIAGFMRFIGLNSRQNLLDYYHIYATAGAIFNKNYFLNLWDNHQNKVDESLQIKNAVIFLNKNKKSNFGYLDQEFLKTGFASAATNSNKNYENIKIDMFVFNKILNQAWLKNEFISTNDLEKDLNFFEIETILEKTNNLNSLKSEWQKWTIAFKKQYTDFGCQID
jgi:hypothetical protein